MEGTIPSALPPLQHILVTHPTNLPDDPTPFIGRELEIEQIARLLWKRRSPWRLYVGLTEMAAIRHAQGRQEAATILGSIQGLRERGDSAFPPRFEQQYSRNLTDVQRALGPQVFDRALEAGRQLDVNQATKLALSL